MNSIRTIAELMEVSAGRNYVVTEVIDRYRLRRLRFSGLSGQ